METAFFKNIRQKIISELSKAEKEIKVAVCWFTNQELFDMLCNKVHSGVTVDLIILNDLTNNRVDGLDFQHFINIRGNFYFGNNEYPMHNKYCIVDNKVLINGSYNWTYKAENKNEENIIIHKDKMNLVEDFTKDFERIKEGLTIVEKITKNSIMEMTEVNFLGTQNYLAQDYLYKAIETKNPLLVEKAFDLAPNNIELQRTAIVNNFRDKMKTKTAIGLVTKDDTYNILIPSGAEIPFTGERRFTTVSNEQPSATIIISFGDNEDAKANKEILRFVINDIPKMPQGEPDLITKFKIDLSGNLIIYEIIGQTGQGKKREVNIGHLLTKA